MSDTPTPPLIAKAQQIFVDAIDRNDRNYVDALRDVCLKLAEARMSLANKETAKETPDHGNDV